MFREFYTPSSYIDNSLIQEKIAFLNHQGTNFIQKNDTKSPHFYLLRSKFVPFSNWKHPPYLRHRMFKTYVLTHNIKVNTTIFLSMGFMKLASKNHGAGHLPPRRFIFNWILLTLSFLLIPHCSFFVISCHFKDYGAAQHLQMLLLSWQMRDIGRWGKHWVENHTNHVLRYRKLLLDDKSEWQAPTMALNRYSSVIVICYDN